MNIAWFELKIPPILLVLITALLMWLTAQLLPLMTWSLSARVAIFAIGTVIAALFAVLGLFAFYRAETTVLPHCPEQTRQLVTTGIYGYTRNPMYLSFIIFLFGFAVLLGSCYSLFWAFTLAVYLTRFQIKPEEKALQQLFPSHFERYQQRVRRWL